MSDGRVTVAGFCHGFSATAQASAIAARGATAAFQRFSDAWYRLPLEQRREIQRRGGIPESERDAK